MALRSIASAATIDTQGLTVFEVSGTTTIDTISGAKDGQLLCIMPSGAWAFSASGNVVASTVAQVSGTPVFLICRNGVLTQVGIRPTSPVLTTPTIASFANATHNHQNAAGGGQLAAAALSDGTTGTGAFARANAPTFTGGITVGGGILVDAGNGIYIEACVGSPEGVLARNPGCLALSTDGNAYRKGSGTGNTGWLTT